MTTSLRHRLVVAATVWIVIGMVVSGLLFSALFRSFVTAQFYEELEVHLDELQKLAAFDGVGIHLQRSLSDPRYDALSSGYYWEIQRGSETLARSASLIGPALHAPQDGEIETGVHAHEVPGPTGSLLVVEVLKWSDRSATPVRYIIGTDRRHLEDVLKEFNVSLAIVLSTLGVLLVIAAGLLIVFAMRPLKQLRAALSVVRSGASAQLPGAFPSEVQPLIDDLNVLLTSTSDLIQRARTQAGNMAHGLKGPLAILMDEAYQLEHQGQTQAAKTVLDQCRSMQTHIDYQIARARAVALRKTPGVVASLAPCLAEVRSALLLLHRDKGLSIEVETGAFSVACDVQDLKEILANTLDNACIHASSRVRVSTRDCADGTLVDIVIEDDGLGLPEEAYEIVFEIGGRWDTQKPGSGLGLAIVKDLAGLYGGDVRLARSDLGGLSVTLSLPLIPTLTASPMT